MTLDTYQVAIVLPDAEQWLRAYPFAPADAVPPRRASYFYTRAPVTVDRALELTALYCAAQCIDFVALEATANF